MAASPSASSCVSLDLVEVIVEAVSPASSSDAENEVATITAEGGDDDEVFEPEKSLIDRAGSAGGEELSARTSLEGVRIRETLCSASSDGRGGLVMKRRSNERERWRHSNVNDAFVSGDNYT